jgi:hypothetical protein
MQSPSASSVDSWFKTLQSGLKSLVVLCPDAVSHDVALADIQGTGSSAWAHPPKEFDARDYAQIIDRLNELVALKTKESASQWPDPLEPIQLWIITHAQALNPEQLLVLGQMLIHLSGSNLRWILLAQSVEDLTNWREATQGQTQTVVFHRQATTPFHEGERIEPGSLPHRSLSSRASAQSQSTTATKDRRFENAGLIKYPLLALIFTCLGWVVGRSTAPRVVETEVLIETRAAVSPLPTADAVALPTPVASTISPSSPKPSPEVQPHRSQTNEVDNHSDSEAVSEAQGLKPDVIWLQDLSKEHFVIAHGTFRQLENAKKFKHGHGELSKARIVPVWVRQKIAFSVITGPFRSQERAQNNLSRLSWAGNAKVISTEQAQKMVSKATQAER